MYEYFNCVMREEGLEPKVAAEVKKGVLVFSY